MLTRDRWVTTPYSRVLGRIRTGQQTPDDITLLRICLTSGIDTPVDIEQL